MPYLTYNGKTQRIAEWAKETGINKFTIYWRIRRKWSIEDILTVPVGNQTNRGRKAEVFLTYKGKTKAVPEWAEETGIDKYTLYWRVRKKWSVQDTLTIPVGVFPNRGKKVEIEYQGKIYTLSELAEKYGINNDTLRYRLFTKNMSVEDALKVRYYRHN